VALTLGEHQVQVIRERGALLLLPMALVPLSTIHLLRGNLATGESLAHEGLEVAAAVDVPAQRWPLLFAEALRGNPERFGPLAASVTRDAERSGEAHVPLYADVAIAVFSNAQTDYRGALNLAMKWAKKDRPEVLYASLMVFELIEAAARIGDTEEIVETQRFVENLTSASTSPWGQGIRALTRALLSDAADPGHFYGKSLVQLRSAGLLMYQSRVHLLFGEWLRREGRLTDSRAELRLAFDITTRLGMGGFAKRAAQELELAGQTRRRRPASVNDELTPQEFQVAQMAAGGLSNRQIAERLYLSHRTVASHLYNVYPKLGITSRNQLHLVLGQPLGNA
jgi:DNA-binding CsgD family transcriptional regulator